MEIERRFLFHANAVAVGGQITRPDNEVIEAQAAAVLPVTGGRSSAHVENYNYREFIMFKSAHSTVSGSESIQADGSTMYDSLATVTIRGLSVGNVITADALVARLVSRQTDGRSDLPIHPFGSYFVNLRVAGVPLELPPHEILLRCQTLGELATESAKESKLPVDSSGKPLKIGAPRPETVAAHEGAPRTYEDQQILTSVFQRPSSLPVGCSVSGAWGIKIAGFGIAYFGELFLTRNSRRLTMIRVDLGSPDEGTAVLGDVAGNGTLHP